MRTGALILILVSLSAGFPEAQKVLYSPYIKGGLSSLFDVAGKAGDYYWMQAGKLQFSNQESKKSSKDYKGLRFEIFDSRMNPVRIIPYSLPVDLIKQYLVAGDEYFDQVDFQAADQKIIVSLLRYTADGSSCGTSRTIAEFSSKLKCEDFILVRSQNKKKVLLLGCETVPDSPARLYSFLYDENWNLIKRTEYSNFMINKPLVQYDMVDYALEGYSSSPIKLLNNGNWLMMVPSVKNHHYVLVYFDKDNTDTGCLEIKLASSVSVEDAGLYYDNELKEGFAGILLNTRRTGIKNVRIAHFAMDPFHLDLDTSYSFNSLAKDKNRYKNIYEEYFLVAPGKGFLFLKEYGKLLPENGYNNERHTEDRQEGGDSTVFLPERNIYWNRGDYTRYDNLAGIRKDFDRGDLTLFYFPAKRNDSCWSGIINKKQVTELGRSYLSYVFFPYREKLFLLYNDLLRDELPYSNTTVLDEKGNLLNEGIEYWLIKNKLVFQRARQISENELAVPYIRDRRNGFAIIRL